MGQAMVRAGIGDSVVRAAALVAVPWLNGGGVTRVIADRPQFRLSLATIAEAGPFSAFPGLRRQFAVVAGRVVLQPFGVVLDAMSPPLRFNGADAVHAVPLGGAALALNLMVPDHAPGLRLERGDGGALVDAVAVFACAPVMIAGVELGPHDTLFPAGPVEVSGPLWVVR